MSDLKSLIVRNHGGDASLLEHNFKDPDGVRIGGIAPGEGTFVAIVPGGQIAPDERVVKPIGQPLILRLPLQATYPYKIGGENVCNANVPALSDSCRQSRIGNVDEPFRRTNWS